MNNDAVDYEKEINEALLLENFNMADFLINRHIRESRGHNIAIEYKEYSVTYKQLSSYINQVAHYFSSVGVNAGDRVLILVEDCPAFVIAFFASVALGAIVVPINPNQSTDVVAYMLENMEATLLVVSNNYLDKFQKLAKSPSVKRFVQTGDFCGKKSELENIIDEFPIEFTPVYTKSKDLALCLFSSGTTGKPKGIPHRQRDFLHCAKAYAIPILSMRRDDRVFAVSKLTFGYALSGVMLFSFIFGATILLMPEQSTAENILQFITRYKPTLFLAQPRSVSDLLRLNHDCAAFKCIRTMVTAGEVLSPRLYRKWKEYCNLELLDGFGSTEVGHIFISNYPGQVKENSLGKALKGYDLKIMDTDGLEVSEGETGQLCVQCESLTPFYWNRDEQTKKYIKDGRFFSDDLFYVQDGNYYFVGRKDEMIKTGCGEWINPVEIEKIIMDTKEVSDCAVIGYRDDEGVIRLKVLVVSKEMTSLIKDKVCQATRDAWPDLTFKHVALVEFISNLPRSDNGKLQRHKLISKTLNEFSYDC